MSNAISTARAIARGNESIPDIPMLRDLVRDLKQEHEFAGARKLLIAAKRHHTDEVWIVQQLALCTYKDEELEINHRLQDALEILESIGLRDPDNKDPETLALGGAVFKRLWEHRGQIEYLLEALAFYRAAHERNPEQDRGYGGINAAFLLDLLASRTASLAGHSRAVAKEVDNFRKQAKAIREKVRDNLLKAFQKDDTLSKQYWFLVTLAEAYFGLGAYQDAGDYLTAARELSEQNEWELQTTFRQLVLLARHQGIVVPAVDAKPAKWAAPWQAIQKLLGDAQATAEALSCYRGKVGLALSGGGFRASFYHLGVLARLAEVDALRHVEVLSTVSGGSILGAQYYLEVQRLLEDPAKKQQAITRQDYCELVQKLQKDFLQGVQKNIRMSAFDDFADNVRMIFSKRYSRSHKLGELY